MSANVIQLTMSNHCDICSMYFQDEYALQGHLAGKKHLKGVERFESIERSIIVLPLPKFIPARTLIDFFQQYGAIKQHRFGENYLMVEFCDRSSTEVLLNKPVWINNVRLKIKKQIHYNGNCYKGKGKKQNSAVENTGVISFDNIKHIFEKKITFDDQLTEFFNAVQLTDAEIETKYESVCTQLDKIFKGIFPKCKTYRFGSTQTGLGFKECDLDIYMHIGEPINESKDTTDSWTMQRIFREVKRVMYRMNYVFSDIISIPKAKTPIIKFCYVRTNVSCDISFKNSLGLHKTYLIKYCISLDSRLKPLMMLIKYWARHFKIGGSWKISNYALVLLIIFYLQQPSVNIIPPLTVLQRTCKPQIINGWQANFNENALLPPVTNRSTIPQLLHGFFSFYTYFDFELHIICPIDGMIHTEAEFKEINSLPSCMDRYKACVKEDENLKLNVNKPMCVQDPIELSHNVIGGTNFSTLNWFVRYCAVGAEICETSAKNDYKDLMETLFTTVLPKKKATEDQFKITISANQHMNKLKNEEGSINTIEKIIISKNDWYSTVFNVIKDTFEKVFKVQVNMVSTDVGAKQQKIEVLSDVHVEKQQKLVFHCTGPYCVWRNREISNVVLDPSLNCLQKEALISEQTIENCAKGKPVNETNLDFTCFFEKQQPLKVTLTVTNRNSNNHVFREFISFARHKLLEIIERTLMHMQQFEKFYENEPKILRNQ